MVRYLASQYVLWFLVLQEIDENSEMAQDLIFQHVRGELQNKELPGESRWLFIDCYQCCGFRGS